MAETPKIRDILPDMAQVLPMFHRLLNSRLEMRTFNRATMPQMKIASRIFTSPSKGVLAKDIATSVGVTPGAVSQTIALLERDGLVERMHRKDIEVDEARERLSAAEAKLSARDAEIAVIRANTDIPTMNSVPWHAVTTAHAPITVRNLSRWKAKQTGR